MNIFVGGIAYACTEENLRKEFEAFGVVSKVVILKDRITGIPRGFGFIDMSAKLEAEAAIKALNGKEFMGLVLNVKEAQPKSYSPFIPGSSRGSGWGGNGRGLRKRY